MGVRRKTCAEKTKPVFRQKFRELNILPASGHEFGKEGMETMVSKISRSDRQGAVQGKRSVQKIR